MKKIIAVCLFALVSQANWAQTPEFKKDAIAYVETSGIRTQMESAKPTLQPLIIESKFAEFNKEFDGLINEFVEKFSQIITSNYKHEDVKKALFASVKSGNMESLPALDNDSELNEKVVQLQTQMMVSINQLIEKFGKPEIVAQMKGNQ